MNEVLAWENPCSATVGWLLVSTTAPVGQPGTHCLLCSLFRTEVSGNSFLLLPSLEVLWPQDWKRSVFIPIPKKGNAKECSNNYTVELISYTSKVMLKNPSS